MSGLCQREDTCSSSRYSQLLLTLWCRWHKSFTLLVMAKQKISWILDAQADPPNPDKIPEADLVGVTVVLLTCSYRSAGQLSLYSTLELTQCNAYGEVRNLSDFLIVQNSSVLATTWTLTTRNLNWERLLLPLLFGRSSSATYWPPIPGKHDIQGRLQISKAISVAPSFSVLRVTKFKINWDGGSDGASENSENVPPPKRDPNQLSENSQVLLKHLLV